MSIAGMEKTDASGMVGHARFLAGPSTGSLAAIEPILKRSIPLLITVFLCTVFFACAHALMADRLQVEQSGKMFIALLASSAKSAIADAEKNGFEPKSGAEFEQLLFRSLPEDATFNGRMIFVANRDGRIMGSLGDGLSFLNKNLQVMWEGAQAVTLFGLDAGVEKLKFNGAPHLASVAHIGTDGEMVVVLQNEAGLFAEWQKRVALTVTVFALTATVLIVLLYAYFGQIAQRKHSEQLYCEALRRVESALQRGHCGLWDWNLAQGRLFWSQSMFEMLGYEPIDDVISSSEISLLVHPDDIDLFDLANKAASQKISGIDETIRMRHALGHYIRLRLRTEIVERPVNGNHLIGIAVDVSEQYLLAEKSAVASQHLQAAIESTSEAFVLWDADDRLVLCNRKYAEYSGIPESMLLPGAERTDIQSSSLKPLIERRIPNVDANLKSQSFERQIADGRWLQINERPTQAGGMISVSTDITQLKLQEERLIESERRLMQSIKDVTTERTKSQLKAVALADLNQKYLMAKDKAEAASQTKTEFLANVSHELRTPLNAIIGFSDIMKIGMFGPLGSERYDEYANDIQTSGMFLLGVINDILEMSKIEAGRVVLKKEPMDIQPLVEETTQMLSLQAKQKNIFVKETIAKSLSVNADRRAMKQILINLISNAVKFTPDGGRIQIRAKAISSAILITIEDTGCGIPSEALKRIGMPFEQVQNQFSKNHSGSGLGLAISKSLAELHGGILTIKSKVGKGTIVSLRIPSTLNFAPSVVSDPDILEPLTA